MNLSTIQSDNNAKNLSSIAWKQMSDEKKIKPSLEEKDSILYEQAKRAYWDEKKGRLAISRDAIVEVLKIQALYHGLDTDPAGRKKVWDMYRTCMLNATGKRGISKPNYKKLEVYRDLLGNEPDETRLSNLLKAQARRASNIENVIDTIINRLVINIEELGPKDLVNFLRLQIMIGNQRLKEIKLESDIVFKRTAAGNAGAGGSAEKETGTDDTEPGELLKEIGEFLMGGNGGGDS